MNDTPRPGPQSRIVWIALIAAALLVVAGAALFWRATQTATGPEQGALHRVTVNQSSCEPGSFSLPAGRTTFQIVNASDRPIEWEILDGVMVVEERENIAPGFSSNLTADLRPGSFAITCGLLSNPRGTLEVSPSAASDAAAKTAPPITAFIGPLSEYKVYLATQSNLLVSEVGRLDAAIKAGNLDEAKAAWLAARQPWKRIEVVTGRIADLDAAINPLPDYLEKREADADFTGFHRIEYSLWSQGGTVGLQPVSARLVTDVAALKDRLRALKLAPADLASSAARQAERLAEGQIISGEDRWSDADLPEITAALDGVEKLTGLMQPLASGADAKLGRDLTGAVQVIRASMGVPPAGAAVTPFANVTRPEREALAQKFSGLAAALRAVNPALGLE